MLIEKQKSLNSSVNQIRTRTLHTYINYLFCLFEHKTLTATNNAPIIPPTIATIKIINTLNLNSSAVFISCFDSLHSSSCSLRIVSCLLIATLFRALDTGFFHALNYAQTDLSPLRRLTILPLTHLLLDRTLPADHCRSLT